MSISLPLMLQQALPVLERLHLAIWFFDLQHQKIVWANRSALQLWDAPDLETLQARDFTVRKKALRTRLAVYENAFSKGQAVEESWTLYPKGRPLNVSCHCSLFDLALPALMKVEAVPLVRDADTVRSVEMLRHVSEMVSLLDEEGRVLLRNPAAALLLPSGDGNALQSMLLDEREQEEILQAASDDYGVVRIVDVKLAGGAITRHQLQLFRVLDPATGEQAMLISQHDVSDREKLLQLQRERSDELQNMLDAMPLPMLISELGTERILYANRLATELYGAWLGRCGNFAPTPTSAALYLYPADHQRFLEILQSEGRVVDFMAVLRDGKLRSFDASLSGCLVDYGGSACVLASILDISHIRQREHALESTLQHERELAEMQRRFVSMVSHEYRTPLAVIDGIAQRMLRQPEQFQGEALLLRAQRLRDMVKHMIALADSVLTLTRLEAEALDVQHGAVALMPLLDELVAQNRELYPDWQIDLQYTAEEPLVVEGDAELLRVVFGNLLSNAIKYSPRWPRLSIACHGEGERVLVSVRDWGVGIPLAEQDKLFTRFFRASTAQGIPGSGIGLALVKELLQRHHGDISVQSAEGQGATFTVQLPLLKH